MESWCRDEGKFAPDTTRRSGSSREIESGVGSRLHSFLWSESRRSRWCSTCKTITRHHRLNISRFENQGQTNNFAGRTENSGSGCFSSFSHNYGKKLPNSRLICRETINIHTGWYVNASDILVGMLSRISDKQRGKPKLRDPERTRERLLQAAFQEVYKVGFQSAGIDTILAATGVTKGALYYHFPSKEALGHAIVEEVVSTFPRDRWLLPLQRSKNKNPIDALISIVRAIPARPSDVKAGCPLVNLAQEMSPIDEQFRKRLARIFDAWQEGIAAALRRGQHQGTVRRDLIPEEAASFLIAMVEGYEVLAKNAQDVQLWRMGVRNIVDWLGTLRAPKGRRNRGRK
jgi:TetR/AcrR family transcriptional regulator, transcriptional repressor for nem operon